MVLTVSDNHSRDFVFKGNAKEWFGIWIVNLLLSIVTIGIYSAWAKVRTRKYFYGNTFVDGRNFDYHATGGQILKGRLIVIAFIFAFQIILSLLPIVGLFLVFCLLLLFPWLITRALMFNARVSSFSNVRFDFVGTYGQAALVYLLYPILCAFTLYTTFPILDRTLKCFTINNLRFGTASVLSFYAVFFIGFIPAGFIYQALIRNVVYNNTTLTGGHALRSNVNAVHLFWIVLSNLLVVITTLGLMLPWAQVRMAHYLADHTGIEFVGSLDNFIGTQPEETTALGDAYSDIEGIDVGLPI